MYMLQNHRETASWSEAFEHCKNLAMVLINQTDVALFRRAEILKAEIWTNIAGRDWHHYKQYWLAKYRDSR